MANQILEIMFEEFQVPSLYIANPAVMSLCAVGKVSGIVVDCGSKIQISSVINGQFISGGSVFLPDGYGNITDYFLRLLMERGQYFTTSSQREEMTRQMETYCYAALEFDEEMKKQQGIEKTIVLSSGDCLTMGSERFRLVECFFKPSLLGKDLPSLPKTISNSVLRAPIETRSQLLGNIILSGGNTSYHGKTLKNKFCVPNNVLI